MQLLKTIALWGLLVGSAGCAASAMTWVPLAGAAGLAYKLTQTPRKPPAKPAAPDRTSLADFERLYAEGAVLVVDVRTEASFRAGHIPGSINVPVDEMTQRAAEIIARAGAQPIVTYCSCAYEHASTIAADVLTQAGACRVSALVGGYPAWIASGRQVAHGDEAR